MSERLPTSTEPLEVHSIAGKILELVGQHCSCSLEILIAALKVAAITIDETRQAQFSAQLRANMINQYGKR